MFKVHSEIVGKLYRQNFELLGNQSTKIQRPLVFVRRTLHIFLRKGMLQGERRRLLVPAKLGYGRAGAPPAIPPNANLVFEVELL